MNWRRRRLKVQWFLTTLLTIFVSATFVYNIECVIKKCKKTSEVNYKPLKKSLLSVSGYVNKASLSESLQWHRSSEAPKNTHVTKSMAQLGKMDEVNEHFMFFNFVPKSGSEILIYLLEKIQGMNSFKHVRLKGGRERQLNGIHQEEFVDEIYDIRRNLAVPLSFDRNVYFVNFTSFDKQLPIYINLIRHPVTKVLSRTAEKKSGRTGDNYLSCIQKKGKECSLKDGETEDFSIPYFCGHDPKCRLSNSNWAFGRAIENVEKYYRVVGILEELNTTLSVLEDQIPQFFKGAMMTYERSLLDIYKRKKNPAIPLNFRSTVEKKLSKEIEFYYWVRQRLVAQSRMTIPRKEQRCNKNK
ncbi:heparan sulfate 2-O-sulfotransferase pipe-like [Euwallacea similis]|uniref:heparan sulfate 2-O-sulfotransferase pipe-like n=1 Tax=Euwallacea similis TaxID=1736056 RepID=UPI00344DFBDA